MSDLLWKRVFCADCKEENGLITQELFAHVFYICDKCSEKRNAQWSEKPVSRLFKWRDWFKF